MKSTVVKTCLCSTSRQPPNKQEKIAAECGDSKARLRGVSTFAKEVSARESSARALVRCKTYARNPRRRSSLSRKLMFVACAVCALAPAAVFAHHSRANYDMTKEVVVEGTVAALAWTNPHIS